MTKRELADSGAQDFLHAANNNHSDYKSDISELMILAGSPEHAVHSDIRDRLFKDPRFGQWHAARFAELRQSIAPTQLKLRNDYRDGYYKNLSEYPHLRDKHGDFIQMADHALRSANHVLEKKDLGLPDIFLRRRFMMHALPWSIHNTAIENCNPGDPQMGNYMRSVGQALQSLPSSLMHLSHEFGFLIRTGRDMRDLTPKGERPITNALGCIYLDNYHIHLPRDMIDSKGRISVQHTHFGRLKMTLAHEIGHGVDRLMDFPSHERNFTLAHERDCAELHPEDVFIPNMNYFLTEAKGGIQTSESGALKEVFAETFAEWANDGGNLSVLFPRCAAVTRQIGNALQAHYQLYPDMGRVPTWDQLVKTANRNTPNFMPRLKAA